MDKVKPVFLTDRSLDDRITYLEKALAGNLMASDVIDRELSDLYDERNYRVLIGAKKTPTQA